MRLIMHRLCIVRDTRSISARNKYPFNRGFASEDRDSGRWRVGGDRSYRQWDRWAYGEEKGHFIVIDGDKIKWFNDDEQIVDAAYIRLATR